MVGLFSTLIDYMEEEEWKYEILEGETVVRFLSRGRAGRSAMASRRAKVLADLLV
jgi:hypothetical protein